MADAREGPGGGRLPPLLLDQTEARRAEKVFFKTAPPALSQGLGDRPHPPPPLSEALDPSLSTQAIEAWKVKCMTFQVLLDLYIDLM